VCVEECNHDEVLSPELDAAVARAAMAEGDLRHAAHHVAGALASDPSRADLLALLDDLAAAAGGTEPALALYPLQGPEGGVWYGAVAAHARLLAATEPQTALDLLCQVAAAKPDVPYLAWASAWLERVEPLAATGSLYHLMKLPEIPANQPMLLCGGRLAQALLRETSEPVVAALASILTRRGGALQEALEVALRSFERSPTAQVGVALGGAYRALGQLKETQETWEKVLELTPGDLAVLLDLADTLLERQDLAAALARYEEVLRVEPEHPWAIPSGLYVKWLQQPTVLGRLALSHYADQHPDNRRARDLSDHATPWVGRLPPPRESSLGVLPQLQQKPRAAQGTVTLTLSHLESPSSQLAVRRFLRPHGGQLVLVIQQVPEPDARVPSRHPRFPLWRWTGTDAQPALPMPSDERASRLLETVARWPFHAPTWQQRGPAVAAELGLGPSFGHVEQILRAALHPPPAPEGTDSWLWAHRVLFAAALVLAGLPGWEGTVHRDALLSMAAVRNDWFAEAAVVGLTERALQEPAVREEVQTLLLAMLRDGPAAGYWCLGWPVTSSLVRLGQEDAELRHALVRHLQGFEDPPASQAGSDA
jgi:tetratricopeptide (TPR) repeat protein